jgi:hypothetical protein
MRRLILLPLLSLTLACADTVTQPETALDISEAKVMKDGIRQPWFESITGSGHFVTGPLAYNPGVWRTFTINAKKASDGSVDGKFKIVLHIEDGANVVKGEVICFTVIGNTAWVGAHKEGNDPPDIAFQVVDKGEGFGDSPDEVGLYAEASYWGFPAGFAQTFCDLAPEMMDIPGMGLVPIAAFRSPIESGNIQIKVK